MEMGKQSKIVADDLAALGSSFSMADARCPQFYSFGLELKITGRYSAH